MSSMDRKNEAVLASQVDMISTLFAVLIVLFVSITTFTIAVNQEKSQSTYERKEPPTRPMLTPRLHFSYQFGGYWHCGATKLSRFDLKSIAARLAESLAAGEPLYRDTTDDGYAIIGAGPKTVGLSGWTLELNRLSGDLPQSLTGVAYPLAANDAVANFGRENNAQTPALWVAEPVSDVCAKLISELRRAGFRFRLLPYAKNILKINRDVRLFGTETIVRP